MLPFFPIEGRTIGVEPRTCTFDAHARNSAVVKLHEDGIGAAFVSHEQEEFTGDLLDIHPHRHPEFNSAFIEVNKPVFHRKVDDIAHLFADKSVAEFTGGEAAPIDGAALFFHFCLALQGRKEGLLCSGD